MDLYAQLAMPDSFLTQVKVTFNIATNKCLPCTDIPNCINCESNGKCTQCDTDYWIDFSTSIIFFIIKTTEHALNVYFINASHVRMDHNAHLVKKVTILVLFINFVSNVSIHVFNVTQHQLIVLNVLLQGFIIMTLLHLHANFVQ